LGVSYKHFVRTPLKTVSEQLYSSTRSSPYSIVLRSGRFHPGKEQLIMFWSYLLGTGSSYWGLSGRGVNLTTHLHLVTRLRMSGAVPSLPQYVFMA
jgi:hypothetical protein